MDGSLYLPVFMAIVTLLSAIMAWRMYMSPDSSLSDKGSANNIWICLPLCLVLTVWLGYRPVDSPHFGDTFSYTFLYNNIEQTLSGVDFNSEWLFNWMMYFSKQAGLDVHQFFLITDAVYILSCLWAVERMMPKNPLLGMIFVCGSLMFFSFGVNGVRNGMACHLLLLGISFFLDSKYVPAAFFALAGFSIHRSTALPIASIIAARWLIKKPQHAMYIWLGSIVLSMIAGNFFTSLASSINFDNRLQSYSQADTSEFGFSSTGFRWDFLIYSSMPVVLGYYILITRGIRENWFRVLFNTYCLANAVWVLLIRMAFSNRFAYLSWFLYPVVVAYPLIMMRVWDDQDRKTAQILLAYVGFTVIMNTVYW